MFMKIAIGAIAVGVILTIAFLVLAQVHNLMPDESLLNDSNFTDSMQNTQSTVIAGLGLLGVGVIVVAAFGLINIFSK